MVTNYDLVPVIVKSYSGYKAEEYPVSIILNNSEIEIAELLDRWYQGDYNPDFAAADYFKVRTKDDGDLILKHEISRDQWFLLK